MKKLLQIALVCGSIGIIAASSSCSSTYDAYPAVPGRDTMRNPMQGELTAVVEGVNFVANSKTVRDVTENGVRSLTISGNMDSYDKNPKNYQNITLTIANYNGPNTYVIQLGVDGMYTTVEEGTPFVRNAKNDGEQSYITIAADGDRLEGSFQFVVAPGGMGTADNANITSGAFNIPK